MTRIEIHLTPEETNQIEAIAKQQGRSRKKTNRSNASRIINQ